MGSNHSKQAADNSKLGQSNRAESPKEKHNSADSKAPLAEHAAKFASPRAPSPNRHSSIPTINVQLHHEDTNGADDDIEQASTTSSIVATTTNASASSQGIVEIDAREGHSDVSRPPPPPRLLHLSELIDPAELPLDCHIRSPSGNLLAPEQFLVHPHRPRSIRERQEEIREKVRAASRLGAEAEKTEDVVPAKNSELTRNGAHGRKKIRWGGGCWCFTAS